LLRITKESSQTINENKTKIHLTKLFLGKTVARNSSTKKLLTNATSTNPRFRLENNEKVIANTTNQTRIDDFSLKTWLPKIAAKAKFSGSITTWTRIRKVKPRK